MTPCCDDSPSLASNNTRQFFFAGAISRSETIVNNTQRDDMWQLEFFNQRHAEKRERERGRCWYLHFHLILSIVSYCIISRKKVIASVISFLNTFFFQFVDNVLIENIFSYPQIDISKKKKKILSKNQRWSSIYQKCN